MRIFILIECIITFLSKFLPRIMFLDFEKESAQNWHVQYNKNVYNTIRLPVLEHSIGYRANPPRKQHVQCVGLPRLFQLESVFAWFTAKFQRCFKNLMFSRFPIWCTRNDRRISDIKILQKLLARKHPLSVVFLSFS